MRVTPEQSRKVQEICFKNDIGWDTCKKDTIRNITSKFLYIEDVITHSFSESPYSDDDFKENNYFFNEQKLEEIDADLFIRTNGTCEENTFNELFEKVSERVNDFQIGNRIEPLDKYRELEQKLKKKNEILKKARIKRKNQREELYKLNLKLQKCISLEEHRSIVDKLNKENIEMGRLVNLNASALVLVGQTKDLAMQKIEEQSKEIEKLKAVIEYLESKVK